MERRRLPPPHRAPLLPQHTHTHTRNRSLIPSLVFGPHRLAAGLSLNAVCCLCWSAQWTVFHRPVQDAFAEQTIGREGSGDPTAMVGYGELAVIPFVIAWVGVAVLVFMLVVSQLFLRVVAEVALAMHTQRWDTGVGGDAACRGPALYPARLGARGQGES